eukprot:5033556-Amphidinium_carterae.1
MELGLNGCQSNREQAFGLKLILRFLSGVLPNLLSVHNWDHTFHKLQLLTTAHNLQGQQCCKKWAS